MTRTELKASTRRELAAMAREQRVDGWHSMKKDELVEALDSVLRRNGQKAAPRTPHGSAQQATNAKRATATERRLQPASVATASVNGRGRDRLVVDVPDPHWISVRWVLSPQILERARAALAIDWYQALPVLRLFEAEDGEFTAGSRTRVRDVEICNGAAVWYIPVDDVSRSYRVHLGYRTPGGRFFTLVRSGRIDPAAPKRARNGHNGGGQSPPGSRRSPRRIACAAAPFSNGRVRSGFSLPLPNSAGPRSDPSCGENGAPGAFQLRLDTELLVHGTTDPDAALTLAGEPVPVEPDGSFAVRVALAEGRQVLPIVSAGLDGAERRTTVLAIERNTKPLEPQGD